MLEPHFVFQRVVSWRATAPFGLPNSVALVPPPFSQKRAGGWLLSQCSQAGAKAAGWWRALGLVLQVKPPDLTQSMQNFPERT